MAKMVKYNDKYISMVYELVNAKSIDDGWKIGTYIHQLYSVTKCSLSKIL